MLAVSGAQHRQFLGIVGIEQLVADGACGFKRALIEPLLAVESQLVNLGVTLAQLLRLRLRFLSLLLPSCFGVE